MHDADQVRASTTTGNKVWFLTTAMRKLMRGIDDQAAPPVAAAARLERSTPTGSNNSTTVLHKDQERQELARLMADFRKRGGAIQILGTTAIRPSLTRRQINEANAEARNKRSEAKGAAA